MSAIISPLFSSSRFVFSEEIQRMGLGTSTYQKLFLRMIQKYIHCYQGSTSNPKVLKLGKKLGRNPISLFLRSGPGDYPASRLAKPDFY